MLPSPEEGDAVYELIKAQKLSSGILSGCLPLEIIVFIPQEEVDNVTGKRDI